jgi:hypothetical protein
MEPPSQSAPCGQQDCCPVREACSSKFVPCIDMQRIHAEKLRLCDALEAIADDLPARVDRLQCLTVASSLVPLLRECQRFEEEHVFPAFANSGGSGAVVTRLVSEHVEDSFAAEDISETLLALGHGKPIENPEALGYMLRAMFEALRRHVAFEQDHILPNVLPSP